MSATGFTKARSMGPVAEAVRRGGGSVTRVFRRAELPLRLIETPEQLILLRDQLALVEYAAGELGDEALPLRLSMQAGIEGLGAFGRRVRGAPTLREAIERCNLGIGSMLQSMTHMRLSVSGGVAKWTYEISDGARVGRQKNELLAFGYMVETLQRFGCSAPTRAELPQRPQARAMLQDLLACEIGVGEQAALVFPAETLRNLNPVSAGRETAEIDDMPAPQDFVAGVEHLVRLGLLEGRPTLDYVRRRLRLSARTVQRRLTAGGARFESIRQGVLLSRADDLLRLSDLSITEVALELGYSDPAHFTRAMLKLTRQTPRLRRRTLAARG